MIRCRRRWGFSGGGATENIRELTSRSCTVVFRSSAPWSMRPYSTWAQGNLESRQIFETKGSCTHQLCTAQASRSCHYRGLVHIKFGILCIFNDLVPDHHLVERVGLGAVLGDLDTVVGSRGVRRMSSRAYTSLQPGQHSLIERHTTNTKSCLMFQSKAGERSAWRSKVSTATSFLL